MTFDPRVDLYAYHDGKSAKGVEGRRGCMLVGSAVELAIADREVAARITAALSLNEALLADLIRQGQADRSISAIDRSG